MLLLYAHIVFAYDPASMHPYKVKLKKDRTILVQLIRDVINIDNTNPKILEKVLRKYAEGAEVPSKGTVLREYEQMKKDLNLSLEEEAKFYSLIKMKNVRTASGVTPVTVLTKPFPCPGKCIFCPNDVRMPKSYLANEPAAQRAEANRFDPYLQTHNRLAALRNIGHPIDKVELIILGGTWSSYPEPYQIWFVKRCFDAMNNFYITSPDLIEPNISQPYSEEKLEDIRGDEMHKSYNLIISEALRRQNMLEEKASWRDLFLAHKENEITKIRCVGLVIETRPDEINEKEVIRIRRLGATKVQIGIQSLNDTVLKKNKRRHDVRQTKKAFALLRSAGFKIHVHWMPNLYGSNPEMDIRDYKKIFANKNFRPDEIKIYPCSLIESAELMSYYKKGLWKPYTEVVLLEVLKESIKLTPEYCRITRMIRDIPSTNIVVGNKKTNFRQLVEGELERAFIKIKEIRYREIRSEKVEAWELRAKKIEYSTSVSTEVFIEYVNQENKIAGFLRLSLPTICKPNHFVSELQDSAIIREIHVYGQAVNIGEKKLGSAQHFGLGKKLIRKAIKIAKSEGFKKLSVISSIGTREYYRKNGFKDGDFYQHMLM